ncbi:hypothetical protein BH18THE1_BH18THE1_03390 [soil metagenome]
MDRSKHRIISISVKNYERLQNLGRAGQSFNDQLNKIFEEYKIVDKDNSLVLITDGEN